MDINWLWQGLATNWLFAVLVFATGGAVVIARIKQWRWTSPIIYGLGASTLMAILLYAVNSQHELAAAQAMRTTSGNIQERVRTWIDSFKLQNQNATGADPNDLFRYIVTMRNGDRITVLHSKRRETYLVIATRLLF